MREKRAYRVLAFHNTSEAMAFERQAVELKIEGRLIPIPGEISAGCGLAWRIPEEGYAAAEEKILALHDGFQSITAIWL